MLSYRFQIVSMLSSVFFNRTQEKLTPFRTLHENSNVKTLGTYAAKSGKKSGQWISYKENGNLLSVTDYKDGKIDGKRSTYYDSGKLKKVENYKNGKLDGETKLFLNTGNLFQTKYYKYGVPIQKS